MTTKKENESAEAIATLKRMGVRPGSTVYTIVTHVARSGMQRHIRCYIVTKDTRTDRDGKKRTEHGITDITGLVATACGFRRAHGNRWDLVIGGAGMDMCFHVVYSLGRRMFPGGGPLKKSNGVRIAQAEGDARRKREPAPSTETDGGYLLTKRDL